jgi:hypothetical protein
MFNRAFKKFLAKKPSKIELYPYLYSIAFKELGNPKKQINNEPIKCRDCGAVFTDIDLIKEDLQKGAYFICEFCGTDNSVDKTKIEEKLPNDIDFLLAALEVKKPEKGAKITKVVKTEGDLYLSVIDISGSMSGAKIEAVKKSLIQTLKDFKTNSPTTKYILVAFESSVYYYLRHDKSPLNFGGDLLFTMEGMKSQFKKLVKKEKFIGSIGEFADGWVKKVEELRSMDMTALGPALYFSIISFESFNSTGRITLLTDGLANQGIGNLSGTSPGANKFYEDMAELTDATGGTLYLISSEEMEAIFSELRQMKYIGKDVKVKIIVPPNIVIKNVTGAYSSKGVIGGSEIKLGAITEDRELFLELESAKELEEQAEVPVQLQVEYLDNNGSRRMRVINDKVRVTKDEDEFKSKYNQKFNVMANIQSAGGGYYSGKAKESKAQLINLKSEILNELKYLKSTKRDFAEKDFTEGLSYLEDELEEIEVEEREVGQAPGMSFMAVKGQQRSRLSSNAIKKRMKKKKK